MQTWLLHCCLQLDAFRPSWQLLFTLVMGSYFMVTAGIAYDIINEPPAIGGHQDPVTGVVRPQAFMPYRMNGQYIFEGLCGGFFYTLGGEGFEALCLGGDQPCCAARRMLPMLHVGHGGGAMASKCSATAFREPGRCQPGCGCRPPSWAGATHSNTERAVCLRNMRAMFLHACNLYDGHAAVCHPCMHARFTCSC